jgi:uncharacterized protein (UPF0335 family)
MGLVLNQEEQYIGIAHEFIERKKREGKTITTRQTKEVVKELRNKGYEKREAKQIANKIMKIVNKGV